MKRMVKAWAVIDHNAKIYYFDGSHYCIYRKKPVGARKRSDEFVVPITITYDVGPRGPKKAPSNPAPKGRKGKK